MTRASSRRLAASLAAMLLCATCSGLLRAAEPGEPNAVARKLGLPNIFSDNMVLQRELPVKVWGWARPGLIVTVAFAGQRVSAVTGDDGRWRLELKPLDVSREPRTMTVSAPGEKDVVVRNVLVGEVWFTAGQSNMVANFTSVEGGEKFFENHSAEVGDLIRVVYEMGPVIQATSPQEDVPARWKSVSPGYSAVSGFFAYKLFDHLKGEVPIGIITYCAIVKAEAWVDEGTLRADPRLEPVFKDSLQHATKTYNGTIRAVAPFTLRGIIYYQAEYNGFGENAVRFRTLMPALIRTWREAWQRPELPFLFVQLPGFITQKAPSTDIDMDPATLQQYRNLKARGTWTVVRESQLHTWQTTPNTGMAVTIDLGEDYDIHPRRKEPIADRLLLLARHYAYGQKEVVYSGPIPVESNLEDDTIIVRYEHVGGGLVARGGELRGFELANGFGEYFPAKGSIDGDKVRIRCAEVPKPAGWRYAWDGNPVAALYNAKGLPATPYRYNIPGKVFQKDTGSFRIDNADFADVNAKGEPTYWELGPNTVLSDEKTFQGRKTLFLSVPNSSRFGMYSMAGGAGHYWNSPPLNPAALRPGCLVRYTLTVAAGGDGNGEQVLYTNMCMTSNGIGYQTWGGMRDVSTASRDFVERCLVHPIGEYWHPGLLAFCDGIGARFMFLGGKPRPGKLFVAGLSPTGEILRPSLQITPAEPIGLGNVSVGDTGQSGEITITNSQTHTFRQKLTDKDKPQEFATVLYGTAGYRADAMREMQRVVHENDHVGAILLGEHARLFEFVSNHLGDTPRQLKLIGPDGKPGLTGGQRPEAETFRVRFRGADRPGTYKATLRVVTQAGNMGILSAGEDGEPPVNFFYTDIPVTVTVK